MTHSSPTAEHGDIQDLLVQSRAGDWSVRAAAVRGLAAYHGVRTVFDRLVDCFDDPDIAVVTTAERVLVEQWGREGIDAVLRFLAHNDDNASYSVRDVLIGYWFDGHPIIPMLNDVLTSSEDPEVRDEARSLLNEMGA